MGKTQRELMVEIEGRLNKSKDRRLKKGLSEEQHTKLFGYMLVGCIVVGWLFSLVPEPGVHPNVPDVQAATMVEVEPEPVTERHELSEPVVERHPDSFENFPTAVQVVGDCQTNENCRYMVDRWEARYGYDENTIRMILITNKESGWGMEKIGTNTNGSRDIGFFQINTIHCGKVQEAQNSSACIEKLLDPDTNLQVAMQIFDAQGWSPWVAKKAYLPEFWADRVKL